MTTAPAAGFARYLRPQEMEEELQALVAAHPGYASLDRIGSSFEGRPLWVMAIYIDGNHHAGEVTGEMVCLERHATWTFYLARTMPKLVIAATRVERIVARVANDGFLPTNVSEQAIVTRVASPVVVSLQLSGGEVVAGPERQTIGHLPGRSVRVTPSWQAPSPTNGSREVVWIVRLTAVDAQATVVAASPRAGVASVASVAIILAEE